MSKRVELLSVFIFVRKFHLIISRATSHLNLILRWRGFVIRAKYHKRARIANYECSEYLYVSVILI